MSTPLTELARNSRIGMLLIVVLSIWMTMLKPCDAQNSVAGDPLNPSGLQAAILDAYHSGAKRITIAPGTYMLPSPGNVRANIDFAGLKDVEIDARGVTVIYSDFRKNGLFFADCRNVTFDGGTFRNAIPSTTQGKVIAIDRDATGGSYHIDVQIDAGYHDSAADMAEKPSGALFDRQTRQWKAGCGDFYCNGKEPLNDSGLWRFHYKGAQLPVSTDVGDLMAFRGTGASNLHADGCTGMVFEDMTFENGGIFNIFETGGGGNRYLNCKLTYGPTPPGATQPPLLSESADAFHSVLASPGPDIEHCVFEGMADDGIAIHGYYEVVADAKDNTIVVGDRSPNALFRTGDPIRVHDPKTKFFGEAVVKAVEPISFAPAQQSSIALFKANLTYFRLTLDHGLAAPTDSVASDPARNGSGYKLIGNTIRNNRARGMLLKADNGLVEGNTIDGSTIAGIVVSPESPDEADYSEHVKIIGNTVKHTGYAQTGAYYPYGGAITIMGDGCVGHSDITIANNTVDNGYGIDLQVRYVDGVKIIGNRLVHSHFYPCRNGADWSMDPGAVVWIGDCKSIDLADNTVQRLGSYASHILVLSPSVTEVTGAVGGIKVVSTDKQ